jgi:group I intron endonuclease
MGYIYKITNLINKKLYIGQTIQDDVEKRWELHRRLAKKDKGCTALKEAFKKHGIENFKFEVLIICFNDDCIAYEKDYIKKYNALVPNGYNISEGGNGGALFKGKHHTEETKNKLRESSKAYYSNPENRAEHNDKIKNGMQKSEKWKKALAEGRVGENRRGKTYQMKEESKKKIGEGLNKYYKDNRDKHTKIMSEKLGHRIEQYDNNNNYINKYISIAEAVRQTNIPKTTLQYCILGRLKTAGGFIWKRVENNT